MIKRNPRREKKVEYDQDGKKIEERSGYAQELSLTHITIHI